MGNAGKSIIFLLYCVALMPCTLQQAKADIDQRTVRAKSRGINGFKYENLVINSKIAKYTNVKISAPGRQDTWLDISTPSDASRLCSQVGLKLKSFEKDQISCVEVPCTDSMLTCPMSGLADIAIGGTEAAAGTGLIVGDLLWNNNPRVNVRKYTAPQWMYPKEPASLEPLDPNRVKDFAKRLGRAAQTNAINSSIGLVNGIRQVGYNYKMRAAGVVLLLDSATRYVPPFATLLLEHYYPLNFNTTGMKVAEWHRTLGATGSLKESIIPYKASAPIGSGFSTEEEEEEAPKAKEPTPSKKPVAKKSQ